ncbi:hypothetical protein RND71_034108 [Anisodus tanguticus]|uniref:DUF569 domain-containing protein n=1 Tax=Anisodus tanguticus TaxID=243964 RepID=A0AAE1V3V7_9SOLA|nr:hypothetical protein RND71_034108 [Anisodus tanguticus]
MGHLEKAKPIHLKTHNGKYLIASKDEKSVRQSRDGSAVNALWSVEFLDGQHYLRLESCYGKYLTASNVPLLPKTAYETVFRNRMGVRIRWIVIPNSPKDAIRPFLETLWRNNPWRNIVTHDVPHRKKSLWEIEIMENHLVHKKVQTATNFTQLTKAFSCSFTEPI